MATVAHVACYCRQATDPRVRIEIAPRRVRGVRVGQPEIMPEIAETGLDAHARAEAGHLDG